jgi:hypothetical protein
MACACEHSAVLGFVGHNKWYGLPMRPGYEPLYQEAHKWQQ